MTNFVFQVALKREYLKEAFSNVRYELLKRYAKKLTNASKV